MSNKITFIRINNDTNGNPRYVCHFLNLNTREELDKEGAEWIQINTKYALACKRANSVGGRKYHRKSYGGGIVFQSYSLQELVKDINRVTARNFDGYEVN